MKKQIYIYDAFVGELLFLANDRQALALCEETKSIGLMGDNVNLLLFENSLLRKVYVMCDHMTKTIAKAIKQALAEIEKIGK